MKKSNLIGKSVIWGEKQYTIVDVSDDDPLFVMLDTKNRSIVNLSWSSVTLVKEPTELKNNGRYLISFNNDRIKEIIICEVSKTAYKIYYVTDNERHWVLKSDFEEQLYMGYVKIIEKLSRVANDDDDDDDIIY